MAQKTAEELFDAEIRRSLETFGKILRAYFRRMPDDSLETLLLISMAVFLGAGNVYQVLQVLGLPKTTTYNRVKNVSVYCWRQLMQKHLYSQAIPLVKEKTSQSESTKSRAGRILAVDDTVLVRISTELGYVWKWWSGQLKRVANGQNVIALILVLGDQIIPLDIRIVSKQGKGLKTKPEIYEEMLRDAQTRFEEAGIDFSQFKTTGDAAYISGKITAFCRGENLENELDEETESYNPALLPTITGIFRGKDNYRLEIDGVVMKAKEWRKEFKEELSSGWATDKQPVIRTKGFSETFGEVTLVFYIPKGKRAVSYLIVSGRPLRSAEVLHAFAFHHRIEEFWKCLKDTFELGEMHFQGREGAHACIAIKIISFLIVNRMKQNLRKFKRFKNITINKLVNLCPKFVDVREILKEHFHGLIPPNHTLDKALA